jgi:RND superfamily putative drug exporter
MSLDSLRSVASRRPGWVVGAWALLALLVGGLAPDLTRLAAEGQARTLGRDATSRRAAEAVREAWPDHSYESLAVAALHRPEGLTDADRAFARRLASRFEGPGRPHDVLRVLGPASDPEVARRLVSRDGTVLLVAVPLWSPFVSPTAQATVAWLQGRAGEAALGRPEGLEVRWSGDAVIGRDYMGAVRTSLDRAAVATVVLLLGVLLVVYRSVWLALVPLATIGVSLVVARGALGWLAASGWAVSPLVELFLVAVLFGSGTDFCLFLSWRFAEHFDADDPAGAMGTTLRSSSVALLTSAGTVIVGLLLMGTTRFKLFSSTGPSVALGLALSLAATLSLTPALLVLLARYRPKAFAGLTAPPGRFWERLGSLAMGRPLLSWAATLLVMAPLVALGLRTNLVQDLLTELPGSTPAAGAFQLLASKFEPGSLTPLTVVLESDSDLRSSEGLAMIDDVSRFLSRQRDLTEVRSATQPLGSPEPLSRARIASRFGEVYSGLGQIAGGASQLQKGLQEGLAKLRAAIWLEQKIGIALTGPAAPAKVDPRPSLDQFASGLRRASSALKTGLTAAWAPELPGASPPEGSAARGDDPREAMARELAMAAEGAGRIAEGAALAEREIAAVLRDPVGRRALDRLLINAETVRAHPELLRSFDVYITPDGRRARLDLTQAHRVFSAAAMDQVETLRHRLTEFLDGANGPRVTATIAGANADCADVRALTRTDQFQSWFVIPLGVFLVLMLALRDPLACLNLVGTMLLTYVLALGATHLVFVTGLGAEGLDWKVPYFLFVLLVAVGVDYNVFLMARLHEETVAHGLRAGIVRAIGQTGGLITSAAAITACSFASFLSSPLVSLRQLGFALVVGITVDAVLVRPLLVPCGHWLLARRRATVRPAEPSSFETEAETDPAPLASVPTMPALPQLIPLAD